MKIVVLDGFAANPGDLSWEKIAQIGDFKVYDRTDNSPEKVVEAIGDAEVIFTNKTLLPTEVLEKVPHLKYVGILATGYNVIDLETATKMGITVTNIPGYSTQSVAQFTMALVLEMCHRIGQHSEEVYEGVWSNSKDFSYWSTPQMELQGKTMGIIGFGNIGRETAKLAQAFGMKVLALATHKEPELETETCKYASLNKLLAESDIVSLHCPLTPDTKHLIRKKNIQQMKDGAMLINTARGPLVKEQDLADALNAGKLFAAAVDVVSKEPIALENPLLKAKNCIITPHIAWAPKEARQRLMDIATQNLKAFLAGKPVNVVHP